MLNSALPERAPFALPSSRRRFHQIAPLRCPPPSPSPVGRENTPPLASRHFQTLKLHKQPARNLSSSTRILRWLEKQANIAAEKMTVEEGGREKSTPTFNLRWISLGETLSPDAPHNYILNFHSDHMFHHRWLL